MTKYILKAMAEIIQAIFVGCYTAQKTQSNK